MTGMPARTMRPITSANSAPPSSFTASTPPSATIRMAFFTASSALAW